MIASLRALAALAGLAVLLGALLVIDIARERGPVDRALLPGFDPERVTRLQWTGHPVGPYLTLERTGTTWKRTAPTPGVIEQAPVASLLAALRGARWHRTAARAAVEPAPISIDVGGTLIYIGLDRVHEQAWLAIGDRAFLVDAWVARALQPSPLELAITAPLANVASAPAVIVDGLRVEHGKVDGLLVDDDLVEDLAGALAGLVIDELPPRPIATSGGTVIDVPGVRVVLGADGSCEQRVHLAATTGDGCVPRAAAEAARAAIARLRAPAAQIVARAPAEDPTAVTLPDGAVIELGRAGFDPARVLELVAVLVTPVEQADVVAAPAGRPIATLVITTKRGPVSLELHPQHVVRRSGEPVGLRLTPAAFAVLMRPSRQLRTITLWREEPTTISSITIDHSASGGGDVTWTRGATLGEWQRHPAGASDAASQQAIEALVQALATPRSIGPAGPFSTVTRIRLVVTPPVGAPIQHDLELGRPTAAGCPARLDGVATLLDVGICHAVPR